MSKLSQFSTQNNDKNRVQKTKENATQADIEEKFNTYKDMSKEQLNSELFKEVARQKTQGTFDYDGLERMVESLQGSLSVEQYNNIKRLLENLK